MDESDFHDRVARAGEIDDPEPIAKATVETLGEVLSSGQAEDVAEYLPEEYATTPSSSPRRSPTPSPPRSRTVRFGISRPNSTTTSTRCSRT